MKKLNKIYRNINKENKELEYQYKIKENENCHIGQKKLLFAEIEFLNYVSKYININECLIVYIGASPGIHINILVNMFPNSKYLLYDILKIYIKHKNVKKITGDEGFFNESKCIDIINYKNEVNKKYIIYITDIRIRETFQKEDSVWNDMNLQQLWGIKMNADFMSLKFRLPWLNKKIENDNLKYKINNLNIEDKFLFINNKINKNEVQYLDGKIYIQIYGNKRSTETRLFVKKEDGKYKIKNYNCIDYERKCSYFNLIDKDKKYKFKKSNNLKKILIGYNNNYDSITEYFIIYKYLKYYKKNLNNYNKNIINLLYKISFENSNYLYNKYNIFCIFYNYDKFIKNCMNLIKNYKELKERSEIILNKLNTYNIEFNKFEIKFNKQYNNIKKNINNNILTKKQIYLMLNKIINYKMSIKFKNNNYILFNYYKNIDKFIINISEIQKINNIIRDDIINNIKNNS